MKHTYYIVALNYDQYVNWYQCGRPKELIPEWDKPDCKVELFYVNDVSQLRGLRDIKGFYLPKANLRPDYQEIKNFIDTIKHFAPYNTGVKQHTITGNSITGIIIDEIGG